MVRSSHFPEDTSQEGVPPCEHLPTFLRGYTHKAPGKTSGRRKKRLPPGPWTLIFDTETTTDAAQRLRIGAYQLLNDGKLRGQGIFFDPDALDEDEVGCLRAEAARSGQSLKRRDEFVEEVLFKGIYETGGTVVGFNLPFDLSRLAGSYNSARGNMKGGFSFRLSQSSKWPNLRVKHLSRRMAFIDFAAPGTQATARSGRKRGEKNAVERGCFLDLATLAAALTGSTHTLGSIAKLLGTAHQKSTIEDFGRRIDPELVAYALNDVQVTRECWEALLKRFSVHAQTKKPAHAIFSEASLGKAYLEAMGVRPWREVQPEFPPALNGAIMSAYYGGRAEVHCRREIVRTIYCDFASMYPTVCTLMGLWRFVIAQGVSHEDATDDVRALLTAVDVETFGHQDRWPALTVIVEIEPDADIFPVRARYGDEPVPTIGVNYLTSSSPLWFTLADCIASKLLTGKAPRVRRAVRFAPLMPQTDLKPVALAGDMQNLVDPLTDDFYRRVIDLRRIVQKQADGLKDTNEAEHKRLDAQQLALKILANATSYGIFIEVNVEDLEKPQAITLFEGDRPRNVESDHREAPGRYFHPLLATLITGAARLLLAVAERKLLDAGLNWAFCDTDSMAFAKPVDMHEAEFEHRVRGLCEWFRPLDPFDNKGDVLEIERQNYPSDNQKEGLLEELYCFAISSKRYALFNKTPDGRPIIRKASGHGLGHLLAPYDDKDRKRHKTGVPVWQEDFWSEIVTAALSTTPSAVRLNWHPSLAGPAASQYTATGPETLNAFKHFNKKQPAGKRVGPFNFMLWFHAHRPEELVMEGRDIGWTKRMRTPKPAAPYDRVPARAAKAVFDRDTGDPIDEIWLKSYERTLRPYARHPETKFLGGGPAESGTLRRRHVFAGPSTYIGKEADRWENDEERGADENSVIEYETNSEHRLYLVEQVRLALQQSSYKRLARRAKVSEHTIADIVHEEKGADPQATARLLRVTAQLNTEHRLRLRATQDALAWLQTEIELTGLPATASRVQVDPANLRKFLACKRSMPERLTQRVYQLRNGDV